MTSGLRKLKDWLNSYNVTTVAMESTGVYWKPVFNILEDDFDVIPSNPYHINNVPGRKTDVKDSQWIAMLLRNGLVRTLQVEQFIEYILICDRPSIL